MRKVTQEEADRWMQVAEEHGFADGKGMALGRYVTEGMENGAMTIRFITPVPAGLYSEDLRRKTPPIMFDRLPSGEIILPGRWWQLMLEKLSESEEAPADVRKTAALAARMVDVTDGFLPADTDTIEIDAPDDDGNLVTHEALPPGTVALIRISKE
jgi:hypothetical protein